MSTDNLEVILEATEQHAERGWNEAHAQEARAEAAEARIAALEAERDTLANELAAVQAIHNDAVFITDEHYDQCPKEVQKIIGKLAVMLLPTTDAFLREQMAKGVEMAITAAFSDGVPENRMQFIAKMTDFASQLRASGK